MAMFDLPKLRWNPVAQPLPLQKNQHDRNVMEKKEPLPERQK